jgi:glyoxylase-like metal-dependent hydrolase (beta-lactamase superfamily II)
LFKIIRLRTSLKARIIHLSRYRCRCGDIMKKVYRYSREILPDVFSITLPLPGKKPGPVNVYLFKGKEISLVDTGTHGTSRLLARALREHGLGFSDIEKLILTHGHPDHYGAAKKIAEAGRALVAAHEDDVVAIETGMDVSKGRYEDFMGLAGVPEIVGIMLKLMLKVLKMMADNCRVDIIMREGDEISLGKYSARIVGTPGHTKGSVSLFLKKENVIFCGDTVLEHITPNAFIMLDEKERLPVRLSQDEFYASLAKIQKLSPSVIFSSHGKPVTDIGKLVNGYKEASADRQAGIMSIVRSGESSVYRIARALFPEIGGWRLPLEIFLSLSEVYTNLQVLQREQKVSIVIKGSKIEVKECANRS